MSLRRSVRAPVTAGALVASRPAAGRRSPARRGAASPTRSSRGGIVTALAAVAFLAAAGGAEAATQPVGIQFAAFGPAELEVLPGETVEWTNVSPRQHTVVSDAGAFASGDLIAGAGFNWTFDRVGAYAYHCTVHPGMVGEVDVRSVILEALPTAALPRGTRVALAGRTADPSQPVRVQWSADGVHFATVATATPSPAGDWRASVAAGATGDYRAASSGGVSDTRRLLVTDRRVRLRVTRNGVVAAVTPSDPYATIVLQRYLRTRFGWWPVATKRLDYVSSTSFRARRPGRVRAVLVDEDGWTPLATSPVVVLERGQQAAKGDTQRSRSQRRGSHGRGSHRHGSQGRGSHGTSPHGTGSHASRAHG